MIEITTRFWQEFCMKQSSSIAYVQNFWKQLRSKNK